MKKSIICLFVMAVAMSSWSQEVTDYGITVNGIAVTSQNADNITGNKISGTIKYDAGSNTLTLQDATFNSIMSSRTDCLNINVTGDNRLTINFDVYYSIFCSGDLNITGSGRLTMGTINVGGTLTISGNCFIEAYNYGIIADNLIVDNSILQASSIQSESIELKGCKQASDNPIIYCPESDDPQLYGLMVAYVPVTSYNAGNIITPFTVNGTASYSVQTNTLTLNNLIIDNAFGDGDAFMISSNSDELNIELIGKNELCGILKSKNLHISGDGSMDIWSVMSKPLWGVSNLVLEGGCEFSTGISAQGDDAHLNSLTVNNSTFKFRAGFGSLHVNNLILIDTAIENPDVYYDPNTGDFIGLEELGSTLVIKPIDQTAVSDITVAEQGAGIYYDLHGRRVAEPTQPGIYIRNGKKVIVKD